MHSSDKTMPLTHLAHQPGSDCAEFVARAVQHFRLDPGIPATHWRKIGRKRGDHLVQPAFDIPRKARGDHLGNPGIDFVEEGGIGHSVFRWLTRYHSPEGFQRPHLFGLDRPTPVVAG